MLEKSRDVELTYRTSRTLPPASPPTATATTAGTTASPVRETPPPFTSNHFSLTHRPDTEYSGVAHFQEVALVFDNTNGVGYDVGPDPFLNRPRSLVDLAKLMSNSWASFIATGNPNAWRQTMTDIPLWPVYNTEAPEVIVWDNNVTTFVEADTYRAEGIDLINSLNFAFHR